MHINVLSIAIKGIFILKHDFFPFQFCLTAGFNNASDGPSIKYYDNCSGAFINYVVSRGRMGVKKCQFYLAKRQLRGGGGQKSSLLRGNMVLAVPSVCLVCLTPFIPYLGSFFLHLYLQILNNIQPCHFLY